VDDLKNNLNDPSARRIGAFVLAETTVNWIRLIPAMERFHCPLFIQADDGGWWNREGYDILIRYRPTRTGQSGGPLSANPSRQYPSRQSRPSSLTSQSRRGHSSSHSSWRGEASSQQTWGQASSQQTWGQASSQQTWGQPSSQGKKEDKSSQGGWGGSSSGEGWGGSASGEGWGESASGGSWGGSASGEGWGESASGGSWGESASGGGWGGSSSQDDWGKDDWSTSQSDRPTPTLDISPNPPSYGVERTYSPVPHDPEERFAGPSKQRNSETMDEFLERRRKSNEKKMSLMNALDLKKVQSRRDAMKSHPVPGMNSHSPIVFIWKAHAATGTRPVRRRLTRDKAVDVFLQYSDSTRRYDPIRNEWDLYKGWDPKYVSDDDRESEHMYGPHPKHDFPMVDMSSDPTPNKSLSPYDRPPSMNFLLAPELTIPTTLEMDDVLLQEPFTRNAGAPTAPSPAPEPSASISLTRTLEAPPRISRDDIEPLQTSLFYRYGFCGQGKTVADFPFSSHALNYGLRELDNVQQIYASRDEPLPTPYHTPFIDFTNILVSNYRLENQTPPGIPTSLGGLWDLSVNTTDRLPLPVSGTVVALSPISIRTVVCSTTKRTFYIFRPPSDSPQVPFSLAVEHASTAVECYRRKWKSILVAVQHLAQSGKSFRTYVKRLPRYRAPSKLRSLRPLGFRETNYEFRFEDYLAYEEEVHAFLRQLFARAALLQGGIVWRIAVDILGADVAMLGPSSSAHEWGDVVTAPDGTQFVDDTLSQEEMDFICGKYYVYTGKSYIYILCLCFQIVCSGRGTQTSQKSWWPLQDTWLKGGLYSGSWTSHCEDWLQSRKSAIKAGTAWPLGKKEWARELRRHHDAGDLVKAVERASGGYLRGRYST
jgi:hypothetical protein